MNSLAQAVVEMTDKEIELEYGADPPARTKEILRSAAKTYAQGKLHAAKLKHEQVSGQIRSHTLKGSGD
jgi:hypothetical protein